MPDSNVHSIRAQNVEKNAADIAAATDIIIEAFEKICRLTGMKRATVLAVDESTGVATHQIEYFPIGDIQP